MVNIQNKITSEIREWYQKGAERFIYKRMEKLDNTIQVSHKVILKQIKQNLPRILMGTPDFLESMGFTKIANQYPAVIKQIFDYNRFVKNKNKGWNAGELAKRLDVPTCPYCNRAYTHTVVRKKDNKIATRPQFDHFLSKTKYPLFALSLYNLIPSCPPCNHKKGDKNYSIHTHIHPYFEGFDDKIKFNIDVKQYSFFYGDANAGRIVFNKTVLCDDHFWRKAKCSIRDFDLEDIYQEHLDIAIALIQKSLIYDKKFYQELFQKLEAINPKHESHLSNFVTVNFVSNAEIILRPLSKLTKDVVEQFELWK